MVKNDRQTNRYFKVKAYVYQRFYTYTVEEKYLIELNGVDVAKLRGNQVVGVDLQAVIRVHNQQLVVSLRELLHPKIRSLTIASIQHIMFHHQ